MNRKYENIMIERDNIGTQLVKKNNELSLQEDKIKILQSAADKREKEYSQRLDDIRLLKLEVQRMRQEKSILLNEIGNMTDLRKEVINLERELNQERIRARALEDLMKTPQNIHRWRKLEGTDPSVLELIEQVQMLQKKSLMKTEKIKQLEALLEDKHIKKTPQNVLATDEVQKLKKKLLEKNDQVKALITELKIKEELMDYKINQTFKIENYKAPQMNGSLKTFKNERSCESAPVNLERSIYPINSADSRKFIGGGFNFSAKRESAHSSKK